jgi:putative FmdB family regulatory protein
MPLYDYRCESCGFDAKDVFHKIISDHQELCSRCGSVMDRVPTLPHTDLKEYHTPIEMFSIGMEDQEEIRAFSIKCPDVQISTNPDDPMYGVPVARTRKAKMQALGAAGFIETNSERVRS